MTGLLITIFLLLITGFISYKWVNYRKDLKEKLKRKNSKIDGIIEKILSELSQRKSEPYYNKLKEIYDNEVNKIKKVKKVSSKSLEITNINLNKVDSIYVDLKQNLRLMDSFNEFKEGFSNKKRRYRNCFNKSIELIDLMNDKYNGLTDKYLIKFKKDYTSYKENEINDLNKMVRDGKEKFNNCEFKELRSIYNDICNLDCEISTQLEEPHRLRDKFISSEDNINQLEEDIVNKQGSLYHKVFNIIKNNKVDKDATEEWNRIKRSINSYKKNKLLKSDVIDSSQKLNKIIKDLSNLNYRIKQTTDTVSVNN